MDNHNIKLVQSIIAIDRDALQSVGLLLDLHDAEGRDRGQRRQRRWWVRGWLERRPLHGQYERLMAELRFEDPQAFQNFVRVDNQMFTELLDRLSPRISKKNTWYRPSISPGLRLAITMRHLASGDGYRSLMYGFRVAHNTISGIVNDVCQAIVEEYMEEVLNTPSEPHEWLEIAQEFESRWNFPHVLGAIDGKHVAIKKPKGGGSLYFNYKGYHSVVLMALVDGDYKFRWVNVGAEGGCSDAQIWNHSDLHRTIEAGVIGFPTAVPLPGDDRPMPYFVISDDAFAMKTWLMKPFSKRELEREERIFNYRLSRARRVVENAFGILANRFRCLLRTMQQKEEVVVTIIQACICLHNLMRIRYPHQQNALLDAEDNNHNLVPGSWRDSVVLDDVHNQSGSNVDLKKAKQQRVYLKHYLTQAVGAVPWQDKIVD